MGVTPAAIGKAVSANAKAVVADLAAPLPCPIGTSVNSGWILGGLPLAEVPMRTD